MNRDIFKEGSSRIKGRLSALTEKIARDKRAAAAIAAIGAAGMLLIFLSGGDNEEKDTPPKAVSENTYSADYKSAMQCELEEILSAIDGVGRAEVMITLASAEEYSYAVSRNTGGGREENEYVTVKSGSGEEPIVETIIPPSVAGVVVVCEGGGSDRVREDVYRAVSAALGIPSNKIYVTRME